MKDKVKYEKPSVLYLCDPAKHTKCRGTACYVNGGYCELTQHKEFARTDENGNAIEYKEGD